MKNNHFQQDQLNNEKANQEFMVDALAKALVQAASTAGQSNLQPEGGKAEPKTIDLVELFYMVLSKIQYVIIAALIGAICMGVQASRSVPVYSATSKLYIVGNQGAALNISDLQLGSMLTMDYEEVFRTWEVHEMVRTQLGLDYTYSQMQGMISISNPEDTRVLYITARNSDAQMAADIANAYASAAKTFILQTMDSEEPNVFSVALVPSVASRVSKASQAVKGFMLGAVLAVGIIVLLFVIDDRPRTPEHIQQAANIPTLAVIPALSKSQVKSKGKTGKRGQKHGLS